MRQNFTDVNRLADYLMLDEEQRRTLACRPRFALNLPIRLAAKIAKGTLEDPLLKQFLPTEHEEIKTPGFVLDAVGDNACKKTDKLLHKYQGRVLLVTTSACAMHCRYCFRQYFDYQVERKSFEDELKAISQDSSINEVILSGGDPLSLDNRVLQQLLNGLAAISHIKKIRFHSRFPIGIPERIDEQFIQILKDLPIQCWFVVHVNHANELDDDVLDALKKIRCLGVPVLNQAVLLSGVNDDVESQAQLCERLVDHGIIPYYLHQLDKIEGATHFEVPEEAGLALIEALRKRLPGYAVPSYVREIAGEASKTPVD